MTDTRIAPAEIDVRRVQRRTVAVLMVSQALGVRSAQRGRRCPGVVGLGRRGSRARSFPGAPELVRVTDETRVWP